VDEEGVMRGQSRHLPSRLDRAGDQAARRPGRPPRSGAPADTGRLARALEPVVAAAGLDLESVRVTAAGRRRLLRIVVDADGGPSLDDIALLSRSLSAELDSSGLMGEAAYTLEVSSPGVDRPLTEPRHWRRARGRLVRVPLTAPAPGSPGTVEGRVIDTSPAGVTLEVGGRPRDFRYADLGAGQVQVEFGGAAGPGAAEDGPGDEGEPDGH
jgi:ribosome maturation factor RimP